MIHELSNNASFALYMAVYTLSVAFLSRKRRYVFGKKNANWVKYVLVALLPVLLAAFRYDVGTDFQNYSVYIRRFASVPLISYLRNFSFIQDTPLGIYVAAKIAAALGNSQVVYFGLFATFTYLPVLLILGEKWDRQYAGLAAFIFLLSTFSSGFNIIKQTIAMSIVFYGLQFAFERKPMKYYLTLLAALCFHQTAIVAAPIYFLWNKDNTVTYGKKFLAVVLSFAVLAALDTVLASLGGRWVGYASGAGTSNYSFYLTAFWLVVFLVFRKRLIALDRRNELLIVLLLIGTILSLIGFWSVVGKRIASYFTFTDFLLLAELPFTIDAKYRVFAKIGVVVYVIALFVLTHMILGHAGIIPYSFMGVAI